MKNKVLIILFIISIFSILLITLFINYKLNTLPNGYTSHAQGTVIDLDSKNLISNAIIRCSSVKGGKEYLIKLDANGQFMLTELEIGDYNWQIEALGYKSAKYLQYPIVTGGVSFTFELSKKITIDKNYYTD